METLLTKAIRKDDFSDEIRKVLEVYEDDFKASNLSTHLNILGSTIPEGKSSISEIILYLQKLLPAEKELIKEVMILAKLILVMHATNSTSERSFSAMRQVMFYYAARKIELSDAYSCPQGLNGQN